MDFDIATEAPREAGQGDGAQATTPAEPAPGSRMAWPPPRLPPRSSSSQVEIKNESPVSNTPMSLLASDLSAPPLTPPRGVRRPDQSEPRIGQMRELLLTEVDEKYAHRFTDLERDIRIVSDEVQSRVASIERSLSTDLGQTLATFGEQLLKMQSAQRELRDELETKQSAADDAVRIRLDSIENELRVLKSDHDALTEGMRMEMRDAGARLEQDLKRRIEEQQQQLERRIDQKMEDLLERRVDDIVRAKLRVELATILSSLGSLLATTESKTAPTPVVSAPADATIDEKIDLTPGRALAEVAKWAEVLEEGEDINILDPEDEPTQAFKRP
jgi:hypothetical protein